MRAIFMIGYQKIKKEDFLLKLKESNINVVIDVRENPFSMRKDFIKKYLKQFLEEIDVQYIHLKHLGNPKHIRKEFKAIGNVKKMLKDYLKYIQSQEIEFLLELAEKKNICLICYEENPFECHRIMIAYELIRRGFNGEIRDLRRNISRNEVLLFCENISNDKQIVFRDNLHSWDIRESKWRKGISQSVSIAI